MWDNHFQQIPKTKTLSSPYQASAQEMMHKILPGDLDTRLSEVKVHKS